MNFNLKYEPKNKATLIEKKSDTVELGNIQIQSMYQYEYCKGLEKRILWIDTDIDIELGSVNPAKQIIRWNLEDLGIPVKKRKPIYIFFFSYGGDANICTMMIDTIKSSTTPIVGINMGVAYSAAAYMYISCPARYMFKRASILFHQGSAGFEGDYAKIMAEMQEYADKVEKLADIVEEFTKIPREDIDDKITQEWYIYADEALKSGVCDYVVNSLDDIFKAQEKGIINAESKD